ncbi:LLM class flavin-dependent oxidoreductase [Streptomyces sp. SID13031]|uniref:LLM class flavin-dependent oxidoreductase n=1 Tax=Streptomyces sp. SID13031 TaxID=2706046 RepID=UPI0013C98D43|nr:LLM class flavin-dependent oxidoreductase [Streptomyces sp. SID13031]
MYYGANFPITGAFADPNVLTDLAYEAEVAGWDGVFVWDVMLFDRHDVPSVTDPWIALAAMAAVTGRVKLGPMVASMARRRPWKVAREIVALDHLSQGRTILGVGLGYAADADFELFGEDGDPRVRADKLDEGLDVLAGLCSGRPFSYDGAHYQLEETTFLPRPVQPRIPIWVAGYWPTKRPMRRAARWQGAFPTQVTRRGDTFVLTPFTPELIEEIWSFIGEHRQESGPYDFVISHDIPDDPLVAAAEIEQFERAGVTWMIHDWVPWEYSPDDVRRRLRKGPIGVRPPGAGS